MAYVDDLIEARDNVAARLKDITSAPKPSYMIDGQAVQWSAYQNMLLGSLGTLESAIKLADEGGAFEMQTQVYTGFEFSID